MVRSRVFVFVAVTLCCVACLCAQATVSEEEAIKAVQDAKLSAVNLIQTAERELKEANEAKLKMEWYEKTAEKIVSEAEAEAKEATEEEHKRQAQAFYQRERVKLQNARSAYPNVKKDTDTAIQSLSDVLLHARQLDQRAAIEILPNEDSKTDYSSVRETALNVKREAEALETQIKNANTLLLDAKTIIYYMPEPRTEDLIKKHQDDGHAAIAVLDAIVGEAERVFESIEHKKNEVNMSVEAIKKILKMNPQKLSPRITVFLITAQADLVTILQRVNETHEAQQKIMRWKQYAETSKENLDAGDDETGARRELRSIKYYLGSSASALEKAKKTLQSAEPSVRSANDQKRSATEELLKDENTINSEVEETTKKPNTIEEYKVTAPKRQETKQNNNKQKEESAEKATEKPTKKVTKEHTKTRLDKSAEEGNTQSTDTDAERKTENNPQQYAASATEPLQKDATVEPKMINPKTTIIETSQNSVHHEAEEHVLKNKLQANDKKSKVLKLDTLRQGAKNVTKISFVGNNVPETSAWSDGSMIVSVPLLAALVASAVLH